MFKKIITALLLITLFGSAQAVWLNQAHNYLEIGMEFTNPLFTEANMSLRPANPTEVFPYPLFGESFEMNPIPIASSSQSKPIGSPVKIGSMAEVEYPYTTSFHGTWEKNAQYAQTRSSLHVVQDGTWQPMVLPWLLFD
jgi:hypothetical protein